MQKTILITGATDGIGLETAKLLVFQEHKVLLHGRNPEKLFLQEIENAIATHPVTKEKVLQTFSW